MRLLYLVRHASPNVRPEVPTREWTLSDRGVREAEALAAVAIGWGLRAVYASSEPKARSTALIIGDRSGSPVHVVDAFDELRISEWIANADEFNELVRSIFEGTDHGRAAETAEEAAARFAAGVRIVEQADFPAAIASHGRVLTAYLASIGVIDDAFAFWREIPMPGWTCIDLDDVAAGLRRPFAGVLLEGE